MKKEKKVSGVSEWAEESANCLVGCSHGCWYCYAKDLERTRLKRLNRMPDGIWTNMRDRPNKYLPKSSKFKNKGVMFPTQHDIVPQFLPQCLDYLDGLLEVASRVLIVSKPHMKCIEAICNKYEDKKDKILFRFTIGAKNNNILALWEPDAPSFNERRNCLKLAFEMGYQTSVSTEPNLDPDNTPDLYNSLIPYITDSMWLGKMNRMTGRINGSPDAVMADAERIEAAQSDEKILALYNQMKDLPKIRWKESIKAVVGLEVATEAGLDV